VYNFGCNKSCSGGSFWSGLGLGLGQAFAGLFGMGGFCNPLGNFGMGGFSMGGFGNMFGNLGLWGGNTSSSEGLGSPEKKTSSSDSSRLKQTKTEDDPDYKKLNELGKKVTDLEAKLRAKNNKRDIEDAKAIAALTKQVEAIEDTDGTNKDANANQKADLLKRLNALSSGQSVGVIDPATGNTPESSADKIKEANSLDDLLKIDYSNLSDTDKAAYDGKLNDLLQTMDEKTKHDALAKTNLPESVKTAIQKSLYGEYENYTEGTVLKDNDVKSAHDKASETSANKQPKDVTGTSKIEMSADGTHPEKITITDTQLGRAVTYEYKDKTPQGEYLYKSTSGGQQEYILQKKSNGEYHLVQYSFHTGYGKADQKKQANS
jgi:hypothetical protein